MSDHHTHITKFPDLYVIPNTYIITGFFNNILLSAIFP